MQATKTQGIYEPPQQGKRQNGQQHQFDPEKFQQRAASAQMIVVSIFIVMDATASMNPFFDAMQAALLRILDSLRVQQIEPILGITIFRDELEGEPTHVYPLGLESDQVRQVIMTTETIGGGTIPESSLPALHKSLARMEEAGNCPKFVLHITDAPTHPQEAGLDAEQVLKQMMSADVTYFCCTPQIEPYTTFANATKGTLYPIKPNMSPDSFLPLLDKFTEATVKTAREKTTRYIDEEESSKLHNTWKM